jgi:hypothetical protein
MKEINLEDLVKVEGGYAGGSTLRTIKVLIENVGKILA